MTATADQVYTVRLMTAETAPDSPYTDELIREKIEEYKLLDPNGESPVQYPGVGLSPIQNPDWLPTYDLNAAAADIWALKAAQYAGDYDQTADGATLNRSQIFSQYMSQVRYYQSRRKVKTVTQRPEPNHQRESFAEFWEREGDK